MKLSLPTTLLAAVLAAGGATASEFETLNERFNYLMGYNVGQQLKQEGIEFTEDAFIQAIKDSQEGNPPRVSEQQAQETVKELREKREKERVALAETNARDGKAFLKKNSAEKGVKVTDSGLQYRVVEAGKGNKPKETDTVVVHYRGTLIDGTEFDSSYGRGQPATFPVNGVIKGWQEALQLMNEGAKWKLFIPADLAYGERGGGPTIGPNATLVFDVELLEIKAN